MSITFEQYSDKSFVVRGEKLDNADARKKLTQSLQGNCIWNTRLKNGKGLLVSVNDNNRKVLEKLCEGDSETSQPDASEQPDEEPAVEERKSRRSRDEDSPRSSRPHKSRSRRESDDEDSPAPVRSRSERLDSVLPRKSPRKSKQPPTPPTKKSRKHRDSPESPDDSDLERSRPRRRSERDSRDDRKSRRSDRDSRSYHRSRSSSSSSSDEDDSSEDERITKSIRRRGTGDLNEKGEELDTPIDSDTEDVVTLSRRLRMLNRKMRNMEMLLEAATESVGSSSSSSVHRK